MTADQAAKQIRQIQWDHFEGRITYRTRCEREERLWDKAFDTGGRALVQDVERVMAEQAGRQVNHAG